jgi:hypothetical protein
LVPFSSSQRPSTFNRLFSLPLMPSVNLITFPFILILLSYLVFSFLFSFFLYLSHWTSRSSRDHSVTVIRRPRIRILVQTVAIQVKISTWSSIPHPPPPKKMRNITAKWATTTSFHNTSN